MLKHVNYEVQVNMFRRMSVFIVINALFYGP